MSSSAPPPVAPLAAPGTGGTPAPEPAPLPTRGLRAAGSAFRYRNFRLLWSGALLSNVGTWMQQVTVPFVLYQLTHSAAVVGIGAFLQFFPSVFVTPLAGSIADRYPRRRVLLITQSAMAVLAFTLWLAWMAGLRSPAAILAIIAVNALVAGINIPAWQAFLPDLVPRHELLKAVTLNSAQFNGARAIGPALAGVVLLRYGAGAAFLVNAVSFLAVIAALGVMDVEVRRRPRPEHGVLAQFAEGLRYVRADTGLSVCLLVVVLVGVLGTPVLQLMTVFAEEVFSVGEGGYGVLTAALGVGGVLAAPVLAGWGTSVRRSRLVVGTLVLYGVSMVAFSQAPSFGLGVAFVLLTGMASLAINTTLNTVVQMRVTDALRGRVMAIWVTGFTAAAPVGALVQGWLADHVGAPATVTVAGLALVALAAALPLTGAVAVIEDAAGEAAVDAGAAPVAVRPSVA